MRIKISPKILGGLATIVAKSIKATLRVNRIKHPSVDLTKPCIFAFWHGNLLLPIMLVKPLVSSPLAGFISYSRDGDILVKLMENFGYEVVRGSTSKKAISGMIQLLKKAKEGYALGLAPDGPRGPIHEIGPGLKFLAVKSKLPIVPLGVHITSYKRFEKAWDKFILPKPFSKAVLYFGEPYTIEDFEHNEEEILKQKIFDASEKAKLWVEDKEKILAEPLAPIKV